jgi:hypothetical protein
MRSSPSPHSGLSVEEHASPADLTAAMRVRVGDPTLLSDLQRYLRAAECIAEQSGDDTLDVYISPAPSHEQARLEVDLYLRGWRALHPEARAELVA